MIKSQPATKQDLNQVEKKLDKRIDKLENKVDLKFLQADERFDNIEKRISFLPTKEEMYNMMD